MSEGDKRSGSVRSVERAFGVLEMLALGGNPMSLSELAAQSDLPLPTIHRLTRTLVDLGYVRQETSRRYSLGPRVLLLADGPSKVLNTIAQPHLSKLVDEVGETANLAMLDGDEIVYIAQIPSRHSMRMFTEVGRRVLPHSTAVGKAIMSTMTEASVRDALRRTGMPQHTPHTITDPDDFVRALAWSSEHGYAIDDGEQEIGVRCVAVCVTGVTRKLALSVSGPTARMDEDAVARAVPALAKAGRELAADLV